jgi:hypothetical protein
VDFPPLAAWLAAACAIGAAVYLGIAALLKLEETRMLAGKLRELMERFRRS